MNEIQLKKLINESLKGDEQAFGALVLMLQEKAYRLAFRYMNDEQDSMDMVQEAFIKLYKNLGSFKFDSSFETWFFRILINCCYDELRKRKRKDENEFHPSVQSDEGEELNPLDSIADKDPGPEQALEKSEKSRLLMKAINTLNEEYRDVIVLRELEQLSYQEIAETLGINEGTVKSRINRAKLKLREILLEQNPDYFV